MTNETRNVSVTIDVPFARAYDFAHRPDNFPKWAHGMSKEADIDFTPKNDYGILDHRVHLEGKPEIYIPLRMIEHGDVTEVVFTLFRQPGMTDTDFANDQAAVEKDLAKLKQVIERA